MVRRLSWIAIFSLKYERRFFAEAASGRTVVWGGKVKQAVGQTPWAQLNCGRGSCKDGIINVVHDSLKQQH